MTMNILLITLEYPPQKGGVASYYEGVVEELKKRGHEIVVVADSPTPPNLPSGRGGNRRLLSKWIWPRWLKGYFTVRALISANKPDMLCVGQVLPLGTIAYLFRHRVPYIVFTHGMDILTAQKSWRKRWLLEKILARAKLVVANSEFTRSKFTAASSQSTDASIVVYPCPVIMPSPSSEEVELLRRKLGLNGKKVLLTLGRVVSRKGHDMVIRALPEILNHVPEAVYVIAGVGPDLERLGTLVKQLKLQSAIRFVGKISDEERAAYFTLCDIFVMPSRQIGPDVEGFGIVYLEAAIFRKPSIGGRSGGVPEAILDGQTGALVNPNDADALARVVVQLLRDDRLREELGKNARARTLYEFTWEKQVEKLAQFFKK